MNFIKTFLKDLRKTLINMKDIWKMKSQSTLPSTFMEISDFIKSIMMN
jgi:hypothetical protein